MSGCYLCPRECGVDRENTKGYCGKSNRIRVARSALHFWEEPPLSGERGSGTVFFTGCSLRCRYCQNFDISRGNNHGRDFTPPQLSDLFFTLIEKGAHNINLVTPTHYAEQIAEALTYKKLPVPVIYNCGGYEKADTLKSLEGLIDIYLPDFKYAEEELAGALSDAPNYPDTAAAAIKEMVRQQPENICVDGLLKKGVIIRHLILPLHTRNSIKVLNIIGRNFPGVPVSLMAQYTPVADIPGFPELNRKITARELNKVQEEMLRLGIDGFVQGRKSALKGFIPDFTQFDKA